MKIKIKLKAIRSVTIASFQRSGQARLKIREKVSQYFLSGFANPRLYNG
jgi:hypothetical protein